MSPAVEAKHLYFDVEDQSLLSDINFSLEPGDALAIIGPNGAGKSSLLKILLGLHAPSKGSAQIFGLSPREVEPGWIGYVPQVKTLDRQFPALTLELVMTGLKPRWPWRPVRDARTQAEDALQRVGAAQLAMQTVTTLSGGELQRVYLARALVRHPKLVLLDEPAAGLDIAAEAEMHHILEHYRKDTGATVVMVTHDWEGAIVHADTALVLQRKQIACGPAKQVLSKETLMHLFGHAGHMAKFHEEDEP
jgi:zinc transport system ATP-binding protein